MSLIFRRARSAINEHIKNVDAEGSPFPHLGVAGFGLPRLSRSLLKLRVRMAQRNQAVPDLTPVDDIQPRIGENGFFESIIPDHGLVLCARLAAFGEQLLFRLGA